MPANVEIKARLRDRDAMCERARRLAGAEPEALEQEDTFFEVPSGRLKLRVLAPDRGELVQYQRADTAGPKRSSYTVSPTRDVAGLRAALADALGVLGVVRKRRLVYLIEQTRVHIDRVDDLGDFVELEVVLRPDQSTADGERVARALMAELGIRPEDLIEGAYLDLLLQRTEGPRAQRRH